MRTLIPLFLYAFAALAQPGAPRIALSMNGARDSTQVQGWPALVRVTLRHPDSDVRGAPLLLAPASGAWVESISLEVRDAQGALQVWPFVPAVRPSEAALTLPPRSKVEPFFCLSAQDTRTIPPGDYKIRAILRIPGGGGWTGTVVSGDVRLTVAAEPPAMTPAERFHKAELQTGWMLLTGDAEGARQEAQTLVREQPESCAAYRLAAEIFEQTGQPGPAFLFAGRALELFDRQNPNPREPPGALLEMTRRLWDLLVNDALSSQTAKP